MGFDDFGNEKGFGEGVWISVEEMRSMSNQAFQRKAWEKIKELESASDLTQIGVGKLKGFQEVAKIIKEL